MNTQTDPAKNLNGAPALQEEQTIPAVSNSHLDLPIASQVVSSSSTVSSTIPPQNPDHYNQPLAIQKSNSKFPLMIILLFLVVTIAGFGGSIAYFTTFAHTEKPALKSNIPPPLPTTIPTPTPTVIIGSNIFITPTISFNNFFTSQAQAYENPFEETNPFDAAATTETANQQPYQNPFEGIK